MEPGSGVSQIPWSPNLTCRTKITRRTTTPPRRTLNVSCCRRWLTAALTCLIIAAAELTTMLTIEELFRKSSSDIQSPWPGMTPVSSFESRRRLGLEPRGTPWKDPAWLLRVQQSCSNKKAGGHTVMVTGAAGFIGSHASLALRKKGYGVVGLDNFNNDYDPKLKRQRQALLQRDGVFVIDGDINDETLLSHIFLIASISHVLHLAASQPGDGSSGSMRTKTEEEEAVSHIRSDLAGLVTLLEACARVIPQPAIIWSSSSEIYGLNNELPYSEHHRTDRPASLYAATKKAAEEIVYAYNHVHKLSITGLRFFQVYGPWGRPDMSLFRITKAIVEGSPIKFFPRKSSSSIVQWTFVGDIVAACLVAVETAERSKGSQNAPKLPFHYAARDKISYYLRKGSPTGPSSRSSSGGRKRRNPKSGPAQLRVFNLGNGGPPVSVEDMVHILEKLLNRRAVVKLQDRKDGDHQEEDAHHNNDRKTELLLFDHQLQHQAANISLAKTYLGYDPATSLDTGLQQFVRWYVTDYNVNLSSNAVGQEASY